MANEYTPDLITLIGDNGEEIEFEILDIIENDEGKFYVLYPFFENPEDAVNDPGEYYIFEVSEIDGEEELAEIEDDEKLLKGEMNVDRVYVEKILPEKMKFNLSYVKNFSFGSDIKLMLKTIKEVFN